MIVTVYVHVEILEAKVFCGSNFCGGKFCGSRYRQNSDVTEANGHTRDNTRVKYEKVRCICEYHTYRDIQEATVGEKTLVCTSKPGNTHDHYNVAVEKNRTVKGRLPHRWFHVFCTLFVTKGGRIHCRVRGCLVLVFDVGSCFRNRFGGILAA